MYRTILSWCWVGVLLVWIIGCTTVTENQFAEEYYNIANTYYEQGEFERATEFYAKSLAINPELYSAEYNLAFAYMRLERYDEAEEYLQQLAAADPENLLIQESIGYLAFLRGNANRALELYSSILEQDPARLRVLNNLALIKRVQGNNSEALALFKQAYEINPEDQELLFGYMQTLRSYNLEEIDASKDSVGDSSGDSIIYLAKDGSADGALPTNENTAELVVQLARSLTEGESVNPEWHIEAASVLEEAQYYNDALTLYAEIQEESDYYSRARFRQAYILLTAAGEPQDGLSRLNEALEADFQDQSQLLMLYNHEFLLQKKEVEELYNTFNITIAQLEETVSPPTDDAENTEEDPNEEEIEREEKEEEG